MVVLNKIYTKTGNRAWQRQPGGETFLAGECLWHG
jgi:hypothetical protein